MRVPPAFFCRSLAQKDIVRLESLGREASYIRFAEDGSTRPFQPAARARRNTNDIPVATFLVLYSCSMVWFEWDDAKARTNERKHGVRFEDAMLVFADPFALVEQDRIEGGELRWQTLGLVGGVALLLVAHTVRTGLGEETIRIISARKATRKERQRYDQNRAKETLD